MPYLAAFGAGLVAILGLIGLVEMVYRLSDSTLSPEMSLFGFDFSARAMLPWIAFLVVVVLGLGLLRLAVRWVGARWGVIQEDILTRAAGAR
jgi:hypothetical protein